MLLMILILPSALENVLIQSVFTFLVNQKLIWTFTIPDLMNVFIRERRRANFESISEKVWKANKGGKKRKKKSFDSQNFLRRRWAEKFCSYSNWQAASPAGNENRIHDSFPNNNRLRLQIHWGKLPPPESQAYSCETEGPRPGQITTTTFIRKLNCISSGHCCPFASSKLSYAYLQGQIAPR